ncbi:hypothetical protein [Cupriavidus necator]|uniref:hypothetical protein n=1 Tax=Cupriavidus necator TaxID=106590 RepID=UPI0005B3D182|nr:hypothetical protein [Cupriavidus necator]
MNTEVTLSRAEAQQWIAPILARSIRVTLIVIAVLLVAHVALLLTIGAQCSRLVGLSGTGWVVPMDILSCNNPGAKPVYTGPVREANRAWVEKNADRLK